jgi:hypothetical protein
MGHESKQGLFLRDLEEKGVSFYSLSTEEKNLWKASGSGLVQPTPSDSEPLFRYSSGDKNRMNRLLVFPSCSIVLQLLRMAVN